MTLTHPHARLPSITWKMLINYGLGIQGTSLPNTFLAFPCSKGGKEDIGLINLEQPQSIRTIFFDAGFTLLEPFPSLPAICQQVCQQLGLHIDLDQMHASMLAAEDLHFRQSNVQLQTWADDQAINTFWISYYTTLLRPLLAEDDETRLLQLATAINQEFDKHTSWQLYPDVIPTLQTLQAHKYSMGVISDWGIALGPILRQLELTQYFDSLLISAVAQYAKPAPALYEMALQRANAIPDYSLHIGDSYLLDVLGARSVGITPVLLDRSGKLNPTHIDCVMVHSLYELLDLLEVQRP